LHYPKVVLNIVPRESLAMSADELYAKYDIKEELGAGAFSLVKLAVEKSTGKKVSRQRDGV
jgi:serine/threonine protein kinase